MEKFYGQSGAIRFIAKNQEFCEEIAKRLEIDGGGENAGDFVRFTFQQWAKEELKQFQLEQQERLLKILNK